MKILVTGGNGYVGREVARLLYDQHVVCVADSLRYGELRFNENELSKFRFERIDLGECGPTVKLITEFKPDTVIHLAAVHFIPECENDPALALRTNLLGTMNVILGCPSGTRLIYASSGAVYKPDKGPHLELSAEIEPRDIYGLTKLHGEQYVEYMTPQRGLSSVIVRLFNVVGPGETNPHLLPEIVAQLKAGRTTIRLGNLWPKRDYIHVLDAARGFVATALNHTPKAGQTVKVNLGTSKEYSVNEIIGKLREISKVDFVLEEDKERVRAVDRPFLRADNTRIKELFGWTPSRTIDDALLDLWRKPDFAKSLTAKYL